MPYLILHNRDTPENITQKASQNSWIATRFLQYTESKFFPLITLAYAIFSAYKGFVVDPDLGHSVMAYVSDFKSV